MGWLVVRRCGTGRLVPPPPPRRSFYLRSSGAPYFFEARHWRGILLGELGRDSEGREVRLVLRRGGRQGGGHSPGETRPRRRVHSGRLGGRCVAGSEVGQSSDSGQWQWQAVFIGPGVTMHPLSITTTNNQKPASKVFGVGGLTLMAVRSTFLVISNCSSSRRTNFSNSKLF